MDKEKINMLLELRKFVIGQHNKLDGKGSPEISTVKQKSVALVYTSIVKSIEDILKDEVKFS